MNRANAFLRRLNRWHILRVANNNAKRYSEQRTEAREAGEERGKRWEDGNKEFGSDPGKQGYVGARE